MRRLFDRGMAGGDIRQHVLDRALEVALMQRCAGMKGRYEKLPIAAVDAAGIAMDAILDRRTVGQALQVGGNIGHQFFPALRRRYFSTI